ncbi:phage tail protein [Serratia sp. UGAL515B_01]|uniref:phage tail protein n=1 Tax=Serratia sp. UGAL515B_01 TaxID=2986763 RepID=UPI0029551C87|nr:phage tail protein [Serratia sp. UGAL515B_01]WON76300.1 tail fiber protein [Serratia sp. UGAL515B_01]
MAKNEFFPFGIGAGANVLTPAEWSVLPTRSQGFASGAAKSQELNTAWRQSSVISSVVAQFIADSSGKDVLDNGDTTALLSALKGLLTPTGIPLPWPTATAPTGWLKCNGAAFNKSLYPNLALAYPSGILPDLRGEFIRGWDDGRGVDSSRVLLSSQQGSKIFGDLIGGNNAGAINQWWCDHLISDGWEQLAAEIVSNGVPWGRLAPFTGEIIARNLIRYTGYPRPRNIAFNYIVRAA